LFLFSAAPHYPDVTFESTAVGSPPKVIMLNFTSFIWLDFSLYFARFTQASSDAAEEEEEEEEH
jgi:hypothetical protein